jgi:hypothetical protein
MIRPDDPRETAMDDLLRSGCAARRDDLRREALLAQTLAIIRRRRRLKHLGLAIALAICYLAGIATPISWFLNRSDRSNEQLALNQNPDPAASSSWNWAEKPAEYGQSSQATPKSGEYVFIPSPSAGDSAKSSGVKMSQYERMRREGDRLLQESGDIAQAVRRYKRALTLATDAELAIAPNDDSWLLMALKNERTKENAHERSPLN